jgi:hypothetical protein
VEYGAPPSISRRSKGPLLTPTGRKGPPPSPMTPVASWSRTPTTW